MIFELDQQKIVNRPGIKWGRHGTDVLAAWVADMDLEPVPCIAKALQDRIAAGGLGYDFYDQPIPVLETFVRRMQSAFGWETSTDEVIRVHDVMQGLEMAIDTLTEPGDGIVLQTPLYPPIYSSIKNNDRRVVANPLKETSDGWQLDLDHLETVAAQDGVTALFLCQPHNPSGIVMTDTELAAITDIAERNDLVMISDEIHCDLVYSPNKHLPVAASSETASQRTVTLTAATKSFNMAAARIAFVHSASQRYGPPVLKTPARKIGGLSELGQIATVAGWEQGQPWLDELLVGLDSNRHLVAELLEEHLPGVRYHKPQSTYFAWIDCAALELGDNPSEVFLDKGKVFLNSGLDFGPEGKGFVRLNFATSPDMLNQIVVAMSKAL